jgi:predicted nucleic acid-binding protein
MEGFLLDTSALSTYLNVEHPNHASAARAFATLGPDSSVFVSIVSLGELEFGVRLAEAASSKRMIEFRERLKIAAQYAPLDITRHTAAVYAELRSLVALKVRRKANSQKPSRWLEDWMDSNTDKQLQIDENDLWIAAQAKERDLTLITNDRDMEVFAGIDPDIRLLKTYE